MRRHGDVAEASLGILGRLLGQEWLYSTIVLGFFCRVGLLVGELRRFEIFGLGEELPG